MAPTDRAVRPARAAAPDAALAAAVEFARAAALEVGGTSVGDHLGVHRDGDRVVTHAFATSLPGYVGWHWAVTLARAPRAKTPTVDDAVLLPGDGALLAPEWLPWSERIQPGDLGPGDLVSHTADDPRLVPAYTDSGDAALEDVAFELGVGRARVMSRDGRLEAASRWQNGDYGPDTAMARHAPGRCGTCGFLLPLAGSLRAAFGVCGNEITGSDGHVVSVEYGCGAHSEADVEVPPLSEPDRIVYDDGADITST
jgi:hypothetical protein